MPVRILSLEQGRRVEADGYVFLRGESCRFSYQRPRPGVVFISIEGQDSGELGTAPFDELREDLSRFAPVELFFDTTDSTGAEMPVQGAWTEWFRENRSSLKSVSILVRSKYMHLTMEIAKLFSRTGELIRIYLDPTHFSEALDRAAPGFGNRRCH